MRNRGYKFIIKSSPEGYWFFCINATWINDMLKERGIRPRKFKELTWEDLAEVTESEAKKRLFSELQPKNFWQMCDTLAITYAVYDLGDSQRVYENDWFYRYPIFTREDIYEILLDEGFREEDALRVMEFVRRGGSMTNNLNMNEFLELYDVPDGLAYAIGMCLKLPSREKVVMATLDLIEKAMERKRQKNTKEEPR
ncbi:MAG: hypothetical protein IJZ00_02515 [Lachnospiraceae bacterium]|nr:hypothetical protein [Lachnospiraceae bacterium]